MRRRTRRGEVNSPGDRPASGCDHLLDAAEAYEPEPLTPGQCGACAELGEQTWAHLRMCLTCGNVGCCDSSPHRHASEHYHRTDHPVMRSVEPGEQWRWCYVDIRLG